MRYLGVFLIVWLGLAWASPGQALTPTQQYPGRILASDAAPDVLWYLDPVRKERAPITTLEEIKAVLRQRAARITSTDLAKIPSVGSTSSGDITYRRKMAGRFLVVTDLKNQAWYVHPRTKRKYRLGNGTTAVNFIRSQRLIIPASQLAQIRVAPSILLTIESVATPRGTFKVERLTFAWNDPGLRIMMDTANTTDCTSNCPVLSLGSYVLRRNAVAGIHGTYFCPQDYASCSSKQNSYIYPVWNSFTSSWRNGKRIKYTAEPMVAFDTTNRPFLYTETRGFTSERDMVKELSQDSLANGGSGVLQGAFSNGPALRKDGATILKSSQMDTKQATVKSARGALGWTGTSMMLLVAHGATVTDLAAVTAALGLENAVNLDGGGSTAMHLNGTYILGPGRNLPNAILITRR